MIDTNELNAEYLTVKQAVEFVGCSRASLDNYARAGRINRFVQGAPRRVLYKRSELNLLKRVYQKTIAAREEKRT